MGKTLTESEKREIREYNNARNRKWWNSMTLEERRARRNRYTLNAINRQREAERSTS